MLEVRVQDKFIAELTKLGLFGFRVCAEAKRGRTPGAPKGTFDIYTQFGWLEFKMRNGTLKPGQQEFLSRCERHGVRAVVVWEGKQGPVELIARALRIVLRWRAEEMQRQAPGRPCPMRACPLEDQ